MSEIFGLLKYPSSINPSLVPSPAPQLLHSTVWYSSLVPSPPPQLLHSTVWYSSLIPSPAPQLLHSTVWYSSLVPSPPPQLLYSTVWYSSLVPSPPPQLLHSTVQYSSLVPSPAPQLLHSNTVCYPSLVPMLPLVDPPPQTLPGGRLRCLSQAILLQWHGGSHPCLSGPAGLVAAQHDLEQ